MQHEITLYPGDIALIGGVQVTVQKTTTLHCDQPVGCNRAPGLTLLPETDLRSDQLWPRSGHRAKMTLRQDLRCQCGSAYVRASDTHHSCQYCRRVWPNEYIP